MDKQIFIEGIIIAWGEEQLIEPAVLQASCFCDHVSVFVGPHSEAMVKYKDSTYEIATKYLSKKISVFDFPIPPDDMTHSIAKSMILNRNLLLLKEVAKNYDLWFWILDVDEYYDPRLVNFIIDHVLPYPNVDRVDVVTRMFMVDQSHFLTSVHDRFFRIRDIENKFVPTQRYLSAETVCTVGSIHSCYWDAMYHYSFLLDNKKKIDQWKTEYPDILINANKIEWMEKIYLNYDLNNEDYWIEENRKLSGLKSPYIGDSLTPDENGRLFIYTEEHPYLVQPYLQWKNKNA